MPGNGLESKGRQRLYCSHHPLSTDLSIIHIALVTYPQYVLGIGKGPINFKCFKLVSTNLCEINSTPLDWFLERLSPNTAAAVTEGLHSFH